MSGEQVEHFLARLYTDEGLREQFLLEPERVALAAGLGVEDARGMANIDKVGLQMAAHSFSSKRGARVRYSGRASTVGRWWQWLRQLYARWPIRR